MSGFRTNYISVINGQYLFERDHYSGGAIPNSAADGMEFVYDKRIKTIKYNEEDGITTGPSDLNDETECYGAMLVNFDLKEIVLGFKIWYLDFRSKSKPHYFEDCFDDPVFLSFSQDAVLRHYFTKIISRVWPDFRIGWAELHNFVAATCIGTEMNKISLLTEAASEEIKAFSISPERIEENFVRGLNFDGPSPRVQERMRRLGLPYFS